MKKYWVKTGRLAKRLFSNFVWDIPSAQKTVYLTFDDGPHPDVTPWVLQTIKEHNIKAVFFCIGDNIERHPETFKQIIEEGHTIGNHTFNHLNGWNTANAVYTDNFEKCEVAIAKRIAAPAKLFRPPYGRIKSAQSKWVRNKGYKIVMWDVLSADFDQSITPQQCLHNVTGSVTGGSIIIFHDSLKAQANLRYALPKAIEYLKENDFRFGVVA